MWTALTELYNAVARRVIQNITGVKLINTFFTCLYLILTLNFLQLLRGTLGGISETSGVCVTKPICNFFQV
jgi:hypothetical protein